MLQLCLKAIKNAEFEYSSQSTVKMIKSSYEYIRKNFKRHDFDYDELCRESGFASSYFRESFRKVYHMTPNQALNKLRMEYASELILTGQYKISEIADACGYENVYYFSNLFKKHFGVCPSAYKFEK